MEIIILIGLSLIAICFFRSDFWDNIQRKSRYKSEKEWAVEFAQSLLNNPAIVSIANALYDDAVAWIKNEVNFANKNVISDSKHLLISETFIECPSGQTLYFSQYGIQPLEEGLKIYGLALATEEIFDCKVKSLSIPGVELFNLEVIHDDFFGHSTISTTFKLNYVIRQSKFVEL